MKERAMSERASAGVLFVCLGNICRSPLAEGIFRAQAGARGVAGGLDIDSCGLGDWHAGELADPRSRAVAEEHGLVLTHRARVWDAATDAARFAWIIAMDRANVRGLVAAGAPAERIRMMRSFDPAMAGRDAAELEVPDPYRSDIAAFHAVYAMLEPACRGLLEAVSAAQGAGRSGTGASSTPDAAEMPDSLKASMLK